MQDTAFEILDKENYRSHEAVSHSDLKLIYRPSEFHRVKLLGEEREQKDAYKIGTLLDTMLLDNAAFKENFVLCEKTAPSNAYHVSYVEGRLAGLDPLEAYCASTYKTDGKKEADLKKKADELEAEYGEYIKESLSIGDRTPYSAEDDYKLHAMHSAILNHKAASRLLLADGDPNCNYFNHMSMVFPIGTIKVKGQLDRLIIDEKEKKAYVVDLKTTSSPLSNFHWSAKKYGYYNQLFIYAEAAMHYLKNTYSFDPDFDIKEWSIVQIIVAVESVAPHECRVFSIPLQANYEAAEEVTDMLRRYVWHTTKDEWRYTPEAFENDGIEEIDYTPSNKFFQKMIVSNGLVSKQD